MKNPAWVKRRSESGYFNNIIKELKIENLLEFRDIFRMDVIDFEFVWRKTSHLISPNETNGGHKPILSDERLAVTLRYMGTGDLSQSLSHQFRISLNEVSYIIKGCCEAMVQQVVLVFVRNAAYKQDWLEISKLFEKRWNYPHALEAIDGKHNTVRKKTKCAFALKKLMMKFYPQQNLTIEKRVYNCRYR